MDGLTPQDGDSLARLKHAVEAGYYRTESREDGEPLHFPWSGKFCRDCIFWRDSVCLVDSKYRSSMSHTCRYFDPAHHDNARQIIADRNAVNP